MYIKHNNNVEFYIHASPIHLCVNSTPRRVERVATGMVYSINYILYHNISRCKNRIFLIHLKLTIVSFPLIVSTNLASNE